MSISRTNWEPRWPPQRVQAVRWRLLTPGGYRSHVAVFATDRLRKTIVHGLDISRDPEDFLLEGHDPDAAKQERWGRHAHAHWLWTEGDGELLDLALWVPAGLTPSQVRRVVAVEELPRYPEEQRGYRGGTLALQALGQADEVFADLGSGALSVAWESATPLLTSRHVKRPDDWPETVARYLGQELEHRLGPDAPQLVEIEFEEARTHFTRRWDPKMRPHTAFRVSRMVLDRPIYGMVCLGSLSHFGFGRFQPLGFDAEPYGGEWWGDDGI